MEGPGGVQVILRNYIFPVGRVKMVSQMIQIGWPTVCFLMNANPKHRKTRHLDKKNVMFFLSTSGNFTTQNPNAHPYGLIMRSRMAFTSMNLHVRQSRWNLENVGRRGLSLHPGKFTFWNPKKTKVWFRWISFSSRHGFWGSSREFSGVIPQTVL